MLDIQSVLDTTTVNPIERTLQTHIGRERAKIEHPKEFPFREARGLTGWRGVLNAVFDYGVKRDNPQLKSGANDFLTKLTSLLDRDTYFCAGNSEQSFQIGGSNIKNDYFDPFFAAYRDVAPESARAMHQGFSDTSIGHCDPEYTLFLTSNPQVFSKLEDKGYHVIEVNEQDYESTLSKIRMSYEELPPTVPLSERMNNNEHNPR